MKKIRDWFYYVLISSYWWKHFYYEQISSRIKPRQRWLTKKIPRVWLDKDSVMEICVIECIRHYVEDEKCFEVLSMTGPPEQTKFLREVKENYDSIIKSIPNLEEQLEKAWAEIPSVVDFRSINNSKSGLFEYEKIHGKVDELEKEIYDLKSKIMTWAILNRNYLWT